MAANSEIMLRISELQGIAAHIRAVSAYDKLRGDAECIDRAIETLRALSKPDASGAGYVLVPREPTAEMLIAVGKRMNAGESFYTAYKSMLSAAPATAVGGDERARKLYEPDEYEDAFKAAKPSAPAGGGESEADELIRAFGFDPERFRTDAGFINHYKLRAAIKRPQDYEGLMLTATPAQAVDVDAMVNRFLAWPLPKTFSPDCGISFNGRAPDARGYSRSWPTGTNLFTATEARAMLEYALAAKPSSEAGENGNG